MQKRNKKYKDMGLDQQIQLYEDRINQLEQLKRMIVTKTGDLSEEYNSSLSENDLNKINLDLDENYEHITILKIRKMMGF